ncbi:MAG: 50S ribosomal protein L30 [Anaerolineaceae bacterium]|jgi:large subunit ribosomal protein L30|nr:50S ribosomal protein L30 [Anaerolineaceae bacterium]MDD4043744.1 50S ribosomal protein L30 [Anaerolineaceae bacterium]MDD4578496.1 50S ribosomal protein L30 [Anaerolineaceae bacterium]
MAKKEKAKILRIKQVKSGIGYTVRTKNTLKALGFRNVGDVVEHQENDALLGMLDKVSHLVEIETVDEEK